MMFLRQLFSVLLVLTMVATTGSMAMMRDRDAGAQAMVICNGAGLQTILVDGNGEKVDPAPLCPDCTMVLLAEGAVSPDVLLERFARKVEVSRPQDSQAYIREGVSALNARAPPLGQRA